MINEEEGMQIMSVLGKNMAWMMKLVEFENGTIEPPQHEKKKFMNFIR